MSSRHKRNGEVDLVNLDADARRPFRLKAFTAIQTIRVLQEPQFIPHEYSNPREMTPKQTAAYNSALDYLERYFDSED